MGYGGILNRESVEKGAVVANYPVADGYSINKGDVVDVVNGEVVKSISPVNNINNIFYDYAAQTYSVIHLRENVNIVAATRQSSTAACWVLDDEGKNITGSYYDFNSNGPYYINLNKINDECFVVSWNDTSGAKHWFGKYDENGFSYVGDISYDALATLIPVENNKLFSFFASDGKIVYWVGSYSKSNGLKTIQDNKNTSISDAYTVPITATPLPDDKNGNKRACICYMINGPKTLGVFVVTMKSDNSIETSSVTTLTSEAVNSRFNATVLNDNVVIVGFESTSRAKVIAFEVGQDNVIKNVTNTLEVPAKNGGNPTVSTLENAVVVCLQGAAYILNVSGNKLTIGKGYNYSDFAALDVATATINNRFLVCYLYQASSGHLGRTTALEVRNNEIAGSFEDGSSQAIALNSGNAGNNIDIIYSGAVEYEASKDTKIESNGVLGYVPVENVLDVSPWYFSNLGLKATTGSYTGTGEYGKDYPVKITLPFEPMLFFVAIKNDGGGFGESRSAYWWKGNTELMYSNSNVGIQVIKNTISWFDNSSASNQFNATGTPYTYFALGY